MIYNEIRLVGEPLLRTQLLKLYEQNCPGGLVDKIIQLEAELQSIKNRHND